MIAQLFIKRESLMSRLATTSPWYANHYQRYLAQELTLVLLKISLAYTSEEPRTNPYHNSENERLMSAIPALMDYINIGAQGEHYFPAALLYGASTYEITTTTNQPQIPLASSRG